MLGDPLKIGQPLALYVAVVYASFIDVNFCLVVE